MMVIVKGSKKKLWEADCHRLPERLGPRHDRESTNSLICSVLYNARRCNTLYDCTQQFSTVDLDKPTERDCQIDKDTYKVVTYTIVAGCVIGLLVIALIICIIVAVAFKYNYSKDKQDQKTERDKYKTEEERKEVRDSKRAVLTGLKEVDTKEYCKAAKKYIADDGSNGDYADSGEPDD